MNTQNKVPIKGIEGYSLEINQLVTRLFLKEVRTYQGKLDTDHPFSIYLNVWIKIIEKNKINNDLQGFNPKMLEKMQQAFNKVKGNISNFLGNEIEKRSTIAIEKYIKIALLNQQDIQIIHSCLDKMKEEYLDKTTVDQIESIGSQTSDALS